MATTEQIKARIDQLSERHAAAKEKRTKLAGKLEAKKAELVQLKREIEEAGYEPKGLRAERDRLESELLDLIEVFDRELTQVEESLEEYDK